MLKPMICHELLSGMVQQRLPRHHCNDICARLTSEAVGIWGAWVGLRSVNLGCMVADKSFAGRGFVWSRIFFSMLWGLGPVVQVTF